MSTMPSVGSGTYAPGPNMVYSPEQEKVGTGSIEASTCPVSIDLRIRATVSEVSKKFLASMYKKRPKQISKVKNVTGKSL